MKKESTICLVEKWRYSFHQRWWEISLDSKFDQIANLSSLCATNYWTMRRKSCRSGFCFILSNVLTLITQQLRHRTERGLFLSRWEYKATLVRVIRPINWMFVRWCIVMCVSTNCLIMSDWLPSHYIPIELPIYLIWGMACLKIWFRWNVWEMS